MSPPVVARPCVEEINARDAISAVEGIETSVKVEPPFVVLETEPLLPPK